MGRGRGWGGWSGEGGVVEVEENPKGSRKPLGLGGEIEDE